MTLTEGLILAAYFFILCILAVYGWHRYYLVFLYMKHRQNVPGPLPAPDPLPVVTIQLPIYNEMYVVNRLIESVCAMDYPRHLLEIQVLDDSTDETRGVAEQAVRRNAAIMPGVSSSTMWRALPRSDEASEYDGDIGQYGMPAHMAAYASTRCSMLLPDRIRIGRCAERFRVTRPAATRRTRSSNSP